MKLIWQVFHELKSSRFSSALIVLDIVFSIVCYRLCFSLTADYLELRSFFYERYKDNSVRVYFSEAEDEEITALVSAVSPEESFTVRHYFSERDDGIFISRFSDEAFVIAEESCGVSVDLDADYGGAQPCLVSRAIAEKYPMGSECAVAGRRYFVCGVLQNDEVFYMSTAGTGPAFVMASNRFREPSAEYVNGCVFMRVGAGRIDEVTQLLDSSGIISGYDLFDLDEALAGEFASVAGVLIIGVWIAVISTAGLLANSYLTYKKNERSYRVMLNVGARRRDISLLFLMRMLVCTALSLPIALIVSKLLELWQGITLNKMAGIIFAVGTAAVIGLASAAAGVRLRSGRSA